MNAKVSRRRFAGFLAGATATGSLASAEAQDVISQAELTRMIQLDLQFQAAVYDLRKRLFGGAAVESGAISLENEDMPLEDSRPGIPSTNYLAGLTVHYTALGTFAEAEARGRAAFSAITS